MLAVLAIMLGYVSLTRSIATTLHDNAVERAHRLAPGNARIAGVLSAVLSTDQKANRNQRARADDIARAALRHDPTVVAAVATLGLNAQLRGDTATARRLFAYSSKLSRRDLRTQLWAIEDAVSRNDIPGALYQYDVALRTQKIGGSLLFPILASALTDPKVRTALIKTMVRGAPWGNDFSIYAAAASTSPKSVAQLLTGMQRARLTVPDAAQARVVDALLATNDTDGAWAYYASLRPGVTRDASRDPRFTARQTTPTQFDWIAIDNPDATSSVQASPAGGRFDFTASTSTNGPMLKQVELLPAGDYVLEGMMTGIEGVEAALPYWSLTCRDGKELGRATIPANGRFAANIHVGSDCPLQVLTLVARASDQSSSIAGQVTQVRLRQVVGGR
ncbi:hypothetical protein [Sphingomonas faeni]|uniref:hypothetical protein n=1 Tax=Sphingomonas faeni TaxID=185950 RepID=UPI002413C83B|nr:hypothetical protein [Sphingomonas faeni]